MTKPFTWNNPKKAWFLIVLALENTPFSAFASSDFQFFGSDINYWNEKKEPAKMPASNPSKSNPVKNPSEEANSEWNFPWQTYMDPKNKEFFKEGDYTPPEPFMELVRNPTDSNLKMWFAYIDKKNELGHRLQEKMQEYLAKNGPQIEGQEKEVIQSKLAALPVAMPDARRYRFRMYFDSHCPHCRKMFGTLTELQAKGFYVEAKQVDPGPLGLEGTNIPSSRATPGELKEKDIRSVPVLLIGDMQTKEVYRLTGYQSTASVFSSLGHTH